MGARPKRVDEVTAVELASGQQVERCGKHSHPGGDRHRMKLDIRDGKWSAHRAMLGQRRQQAKELRIAKL